MKNVTAWNPNAPQWWITGFNPQEEYEDKDVDKQVMIGNVKFEGNAMYSSFCQKVSERDDIKDYIITDEDNKTIWIIWYDKEIT